MTARSFPPPWTDNQVMSANDYQRAGVWHEFTCPNSGDGLHLTTGRHMGGTSEGVLVAINKGWVCLSCDYEQDWAHDWMLNDDWRTMFELFL